MKIGNTTNTFIAGVMTMSEARNNMSEQKVTLVIDTAYTAPHSKMPTHVEIDGKTYEVSELFAALDWALEQYRKAQREQGEGG